MAAADGKVIVTGGFARFEMPTLPSVDFPSLSDMDLPVTFAMEVPALKALIDRTRFAISTEDTRYYLNGLFLHAPAGDEPVMTAAATDGHRLAVVTVPLPDGAEGMPDVIIGRKCVAVLRKLLDGAEGLVEISVSQSRIRFHLGTAIVVSKLIDGTFPDYTRVIPTGNDKLLLIEPKRLRQGVDRVAIVASDKTRAVKMAVDRDKVTLSVTSPENGIATEEIAADYGAAPIVVGMNAKYLTDVLGQIGGDLIQIEMSDGAGPLLIRDPADPSATYIIMPMRV
jgi:DNA polymerase-3 subunit beta